jgi:hypothetical protein
VSETQSVERAPLHILITFGAIRFSTSSAAAAPRAFSHSASLAVRFNASGAEATGDFVPRMRNVPPPTPLVHLIETCALRFHRYHVIMITIGLS